jgi:hypothetical protein
MPKFYVCMPVYFPNLLLRWRMDEFLSKSFWIFLLQNKQFYVEYDRASWLNP